MSRHPFASQQQPDRQPADAADSEGFAMTISYGAGLAWEGLVRSRDSSKIGTL